jgi:predicted AAA+ superfamily ATPase
MGIVAASTGSQINLTKLGADVSLDARTVDSWLSILEESYIIFRLYPYYNHLGKRFVKTPKIYFYDTGLLCVLLGFNHADDLKFHSLRGHIFEAAVISETVKKYFNAGQRPRIHYWRDINNKEKEVDLIEESPKGLVLTEIKSSQTANKDYVKNLISYTPSAGTEIKSRRVIYDGSDKPVFSGVRYYNWRNF